ncbi:MAG: 4'-phosphopantetheinyl transferase family protein [Acidimicrobiales bacterium]
MTGLGSTREVDVWLATVQGDEGLARRQLDDEELARADRFVRPTDRYRHTIAHATLRYVLARYVDEPPRSLRLVADPCQHCGRPHGKPRLAGDAGHDFNLSHSGTLVAVAVARRRRVGVDVQEVTPVDAPGMARRFFTPAEAACVAATARVETRQRLFHELWTRKEAVLKATGAGLLGGPGRLDVRDPGAGDLLLVTAPGLDRPVGIQGLTTPTGYVGAVAAEGDDWTLTTRPIPSVPALRHAPARGSAR